MVINWGTILICTAIHSFYQHFHESSVYTLHTVICMVVCMDRFSDPCCRVCYESLWQAGLCYNVIQLFIVGVYFKGTVICGY